MCKYIELKLPLYTKYTVSYSTYTTGYNKLNKYKNYVFYQQIFVTYCTYFCCSIYRVKFQVIERYREFNF